MRSFALVSFALVAGCAVDATVGEIDRCALGIHADDLASLETAIARPFDLVRYYHDWNDAFPTADEQASGHGIILSFSGKNGSSPISFARVANPDDAEVSAELAAMAARVRAYGRPIFLVYHDEANNDSAYGSPEEYVAAFRRIVGTFRAAGATNARWVWSLSSSAFPTAADAWYPGDDVVDYIGATGFNWFMGTDTPWRTFAGVFASFFEWSLAHPKPLAIVSTSTGENPNTTADAPKSKATWFREANDTIASEPRLQLVVWYSNGSDDLVYKDWRIDSSPNALAAFAQLAADPHFDITP
ncbi:MAG TPA: glycosyl hydrolase [Kofleriaceae bacterium]